MNLAFEQPIRVPNGLVGSGVNYAWELEVAGRADGEDPFSGPVPGDAILGFSVNVVALDILPYLNCEGGVLYIFILKWQIHRPSVRASATDGV